MTGSIWSVLDIEPTDDRAALRRAYATRLKVTNPEDDPEGFQALRMAYDSALSRAGRTQGALLPWVPAPPAPRNDPPSASFDGRPLEPEAPVLRGPRDETGRTKSARPPAPQNDLPPELASKPEAPEHAGLLDEIKRLESLHAEAIGRLERLLSAETPGHSAVKSALSDVLGGAAMQQLEIYDRTELWFARILQGDSVGLDMVIGPVAAFFKWQEAAAAPYVSHTIFLRLRHLAILRAMAVSGHAYYNAYRALTRPPRGVQLWRNRLTFQLRTEVRDVLTSATEKNLVRYFSPQAMAWWRPRVKPLSGVAAGLWNTVVVLGGLALVVGVFLLSTSGQ